MNHFLRTGFEMFTSGKGADYVAEKAESNSGWIFPVGDELNELGYNHMFAEMFNCIENEAARNRLISVFDWETTIPEQALGYRFDIVLRGREETPMEKMP